jgi:hypothetical protein
MSGMSPTGVKFELRLRHEAEGRTHYDVELKLPEAHHEGTATIEPEAGRVAFEWQTAPPDWCENTVRAQLRTLYRERASGYPRRVTRWRPAPEGAAG